MSVGRMFCLLFRSVWRWTFERALFNEIERKFKFNFLTSLCSAEQIQFVISQMC